MTSLIVRKLDEGLKASLRLRAAKNGRSVEDEVRMILREAAEERTESAPQHAPAVPASSSRPLPVNDSTNAPRVSL